MAHRVNVTNEITQTVSFVVRESMNAESAIEQAIRARRDGQGESVAVDSDDNANALKDAYLADSDGDVELIGSSRSLDEMMRTAFLDCLANSDLVLLRLYTPETEQQAPEEQLVANLGPDAIVELMDLDEVRYVLLPEPAAITDQGFLVDVTPIGDMEQTPALVQFRKKEVITRYQAIKPDFITI